MMAKYYSTLRPVGPGTFPKEGMVSFKNFDRRTMVDEIGHMAWGYLIYDRKLSKKEADSYDLVYAGSLSA